MDKCFSFLYLPLALLYVKGLLLEKQDFIGSQEIISRVYSFMCFLSILGFTIIFFRKADRSLILGDCLSRRWSQWYSVDWSLIDKVKFNERYRFIR